MRKGNGRYRNINNAENEEKTPKTAGNAKIFASLHLCAFALIRLRLRCARSSAVNFTAELRRVVNRCGLAKISRERSTEGQKTSGEKRKNRPEAHGRPGRESGFRFLSLFPGETAKSVPEFRIF